MASGSIWILEMSWAIILALSVKLINYLMIIELLEKKKKDSIEKITLKCGGTQELIMI